MKDNNEIEINDTIFNTITKISRVKSKKYFNISLPKEPVPPVINNVEFLKLILFFIF